MKFDLLPSYVFVYSNQPTKGISQLKVDGVLRLLVSPGNDYCLQGDDQIYALGLLERNGLINVLNVLQIGDTVTLSDELFSGCKKVIQSDHRKQRAKVLFYFSKMQFFTWIACNTILPTNQFSI